MSARALLTTADADDADALITSHHLRCSPSLL